MQDGQDGGASESAHTPPAASPTFTRLDVLLLLSVFLLALTVRVVYVFQMRSSPLFDHPIMDAAYHDEWARAIAEGRTFMEGPFFRAPLYPWFLGAVYTILGPGFLAARLIQACLGAVSCGLIYLIGRSTFSRLAGAVAAFGAATYWVFCYFDAELLIVPLIVFLDLLLLWLVLRAGRRPTTWRWLAAGVVLGLSAIARPNILIFAPVVVLWMLLNRRLRSVPRLAAFCGGCMIPVLPITAYNYFVGHDAVLISSQGGVNFFIGNNPRSDGVTAVVPGTPADWWGGYFASQRMAEQASGRSLKPSEVSRFYFRQGLRYWRELPGGALSLLFHKLTLFWTPRELGNNKDPHFFANRFTPIVRLLPLSFIVIAPLALTGIVLRWRDWRALLPLWGFAVIYTAGVVAFFVNSRFRVPIVPVLLLFGAEAVAWGVSRVRQRAWSQIGGVAMLTVCTGVLLRLITAPQVPSTDAHSYQTLAAVYYDKGQYEQAAEWAQRWCTALPSSGMAHAVRAKSLAAMGVPEQGITELRQYVAVNAAEPSALRALTALLAESNRHGEAIAVLREAFRAHPHDMGIASQLAWYLATSPQDALRDGEEALTLALRVRDATNGRVADALDVLAAAYAESGRFEEACTTAEQAVELARASRQGDLADRIEARLASYKSRQPYRE